jgi:hypothetical protein
MSVPTERISFPDLRRRVPHVRISVHGPKTTFSNAFTSRATFALVAKLCPNHNSRVPHIPDFLWSLVGSANFMRLSLKKGAQAVVSGGSVQGMRGISLVFREMWDTTNLRVLCPYCPKTLGSSSVADEGPGDYNGRMRSEQRRDPGVPA